MYYFYNYYSLNITVRVSHNSKVNIILYLNNSVHKQIIFIKEHNF